MISEYWKTRRFNRAAIYPRVCVCVESITSVSMEGGGGEFSIEKLNRLTDFESRELNITRTVASLEPVSFVFYFFFPLLIVRKCVTSRGGGGGTIIVIHRYFLWDREKGENIIRCHSLPRMARFVSEFSLFIIRAT